MFIGPQIFERFVGLIVADHRAEEKICQNLYQKSKSQQEPRRVREPMVRHRFREQRLRQNLKRSREFLV